ncbi:MAG: hypothetical protein Q8M18_02495 [Bradyrhizobium sp.]|nr:hypothetical protein [Bradyrhizobium sp.]
MEDRPVFRTVARPGKSRRIALSAAISLAVGCGMLASPASSQSFTDRFKNLFGGKSEEAPPPAPGAPPAAADEAPSGLYCPPVSIRAGASTYQIAAPGKQPVGNDLRFQVTITRTARECSYNAGEITARIGIQGRVIAGPAGAPATVDIPMRVAVVQSGVQEKTIATRAYRTSVTMSEDGSVPFTLIAEDMVYPAPSGAIGDSYIFYIGFDPQALKPEPRSRRR